MSLYPEGDFIAAGEIRMQAGQTSSRVCCSWRLQEPTAPFLPQHPDDAIRALDEAPDGRRLLDLSGRGLRELRGLSEEVLNARVVLLNDNLVSESLGGTF
eukprot:754583-Hanusia_phi.AAC.4